MEPSNYANRHDQVGVADNTPTSKQIQREPSDFGSYTMNTTPSPQEPVKDRDDIYDPGSRTQGSSTIKNAGNDAKWNTVSSTEIGDPTGRVPTARDTHEKLVVAKNTELPIGSSGAAPGHSTRGYGDVTPGIPTTVRQHRNSNYAPGYESAAAAVHHRSHKAADHHPSLLSHEPVTPLTEMPPDITGQTDYLDGEFDGKGTVPRAEH